MYQVFDKTEILKIEKQTCKETGCTISDLMNRAGVMVTKDLLKRVIKSRNQRFLIVANTGNNGGDALVVYLELKKLGFNVTLFCLGDVEKAHEAYMFYYNMLSKDEIFFGLEELETEINNYDLIVDGIFGYGLDRDVVSDYAKLIDIINNSKKEVYSIDIPSGINSNNGLVMNKAIKAKYTGVLGYYKLGNLLNDALDYHGNIEVLDIGLIEKKSNINYILNEEVDLSKTRKHNSHKYDYGVYGYIGSSSLPGAINLSAYAGLKSGVGMVDVFYPQELVRFYPEIIYRNLKELSVKRYDGFVFGPGITEQNNQYSNCLNEIIASKKKVVVDAFAISYLSPNNVYENIIITPHLKEFSRFIGHDTDLIKANPIKYLSSLKGIVTVLKGSTTFIAKDGLIYLLQAKNTGLAKAGSGDVLTGMISGYLKDFNLFDAALKGVALHNLAANYAKEEFGESSMIASDIINAISKVLR